MRIVSLSENKEHTNEKAIGYEIDEMNEEISKRLSGALPEGCSATAHSHIFVVRYESIIAVATEVTKCIEKELEIIHEESEFQKQCEKEAAELERKKHEEFLQELKQLTGLELSSEIDRTPFRGVRAINLDG